MSAFLDKAHKEMDKLPQSDDVALLPYPRGVIEQYDGHSTVKLWDDDAGRLSGLSALIEQVIHAVSPRARIIRKRSVRDVAGPWGSIIDFKPERLTPSPVGDDLRELLAEAREWLPHVQAKAVSDTMARIDAALQSKDREAGR